MKKMTSAEYFEFLEKTNTRLTAKIRSKNLDYTNGAGPFANFEGAEDFGVDTLVGLAVRMNDKMQRLKSFCKQGGLAVTEKGDTIADIFDDFIGYSWIALAILEEKKGIADAEITSDTSVRIIQR